MVRQAAILQTSGTREATLGTMKKTIKAMPTGNEHKGKINAKYTFCKTHAEHPALLNPTRAKNNNNRRIKWLLYKHINDWTDVVKGGGH